MEQMSIPFGFFVLFLLAGLTLTVIYDGHLREEYRRSMLGIIGLCFALVVQNYLEDWLAAGEARVLARTMTAIAGYVIRPLVIVMFLRIVAPKWKHRPAWILAGVNACVYLTALFSRAAFWIAEDNHYQGGPLRYTCLIVSAILLVYLFVLTIHEYSKAPLREMIVPALIVVMVAVSIWLDGEVGGARQPVTFLTVAMVVSCVFYYIWLHTQFVREHEEDLKAHQRMQIIKSQIRPNFLYNTLNTIQELCRSDPAKAAEITNDFNLYLRENMEFMDMPGLIPFWKELDHTKSYVRLAEARFSNIRGEYGIRDAAFSLPPLTLQPIVENAVRHGVRAREKGVVQILTQQKEDMHEIVIRDNGSGFDPEGVFEKKSDHIGLRNVRERIADMCGGTLTVDSRIGEGTTVTIRIPVQEANGQDRV